MYQSASRILEWEINISGLFKEPRCAGALPERPMPFVVLLCIPSCNPGQLSQVACPSLRRRPRSSLHDNLQATMWCRARAVSAAMHSFCMRSPRRVVGARLCSVGAQAVPQPTSAAASPTLALMQPFSLLLNILYASAAWASGGRCVMTNEGSSLPSCGAQWQGGGGGGELGGGREEGLWGRVKDVTSGAHELAALGHCCT